MEAARSSPIPSPFLSQLVEAKLCQESPRVSRNTCALCGAPLRRERDAHSLVAYTCTCGARYRVFSTGVVLQVPNKRFPCGHAELASEPVTWIENYSEEDIGGLDFRFTCPECLGQWPLSLDGGG